MTSTMRSLPPCRTVTGHYFGHDAEMAVIIEDGQFRARDNFGAVMRMDDIDHAVASPVQDSYRALDGSDIKGDPARAVSQTIVGVALQAVGEHGRETCHRLLHPLRITEQRQ